MYKEASRLKLKFSTTYGRVGVERLWDLNKSELRDCIIEIHEKIKSDTEGLDFLESRSVDSIDKLKYDILKDIYQTKQKEQEFYNKQIEIKEREQYLLNIIEEKKHESIKNKSVEELEKELEELNKLKVK